MKNSINRWQDLVNKSILLIINEKKFYGSFYTKEQQLFLNVTMTNDIEEWRNACHDFDCISAYFVEDNKIITLLNCMYSGHSSSGFDPILNASVIFLVDRVLLDYDIKDYSTNFISNISVEYSDISWFTNKKTFNNEILNDSISITPIYKEYKMKDKTIIFDILPSISESSNTIKVSGKIRFTYVFNNKRNLDSSLQYVYCIKNLLMLFGKRNIDVIKQKINDDLVSYELIDCGIYDNIELENQDLIERLNHRNGFKIEKIDNFTSIVEKFEVLYNRLTPLLELYYNVVKYKIPDLARLVNDLTMLENYSREFDYANALALTIAKNGKKQKNGPDFADMVKSLINNVNCIFNFSVIDIDNISKKIKDVRTYYVHYDINSGLVLNEDEMFRYVYFIEDVIVLNIYLLLGIDINKIRYVSYNGYYYETVKLI